MDIGILLNSYSVLIRSSAYVIKYVIHILPLKEIF